MDCSRTTRRGSSASLLAVAVVVVVAMLSAVGVGGDFAADRAECSDKLVGLATCLTYVQEQATASAPTSDCCAGLRTVLQSSRKCLCVLVRDRDDPNLGLKLNVTKALGLPAVCHGPANISDCPRLLNLPPNSKEAQVFEEYGKQAAAQSGATAGGGSEASAQKSGAAGGPARRRWLAVGGSRGVGDAGARAVALVALFLFAVPFLLLLG